MSPFTLSNLWPSSEKQSISGSCECNITKCNFIMVILYITIYNSGILKQLCTLFLACWFYPVNCFKDGLCSCTTRSKGLQAWRGLTQVHSCHQYSKKHLQNNHRSRIAKQCPLFPECVNLKGLRWKVECIWFHILELEHQETVPWCRWPILIRTRRPERSKGKWCTTGILETPLWWCPFSHPSSELPQGFYHTCANVMF